jgi:diacylglycerol kinase family enzyme
MAPPRSTLIRPVPAFINSAAGSADDVAAAVRATGRFEVRRVSPGRLTTEVTAALRAGVRRVLVAGGDGTITTAASVLVGTPTELAILPGGTLNHFAKDFGIPLEPAAALEVAVGDAVRTVDVGLVNGRLFLNTSSVGAYVVFVRLRERLERRLGYRLASIVAFLRVFASLPTLRVQLEIDGQRRTYRTPLVFIGVGERELRVPMLGSRVAGGRRGLHVIVPRGRTRLRLAALTFTALLHGVRAVVESLRCDSFIVERCRIDMRRPHGNVAIDGELVPMIAPLEYHVERDALRVVAPERSDAAEPPYQGAGRPTSSA